MNISKFSGWDVARLVENIESLALAGPEVDNRNLVQWPCAVK